MDTSHLMISSGSADFFVQLKQSKFRCMASIVKNSDPQLM